MTFIRKGGGARMKTNFFFAIVKLGGGGIELRIFVEIHQLKETFCT